jgi:hypothetical protein
LTSSLKEFLEFYTEIVIYHLIKEFKIVT